MNKHFRTFLCVLLLPFLFFALLVSFYSGDVFAVSPPLLRVGISLSGSHLVLDIENGDVIINQGSGAQIPLSPGRYRLENNGGSIQISCLAGNSYGGFDGPLSLVPARNSFVIGNARNGSVYRGGLEVLANGTAAVVAVNLVDLESYLQGVVPREMPPAWGNYGGMEALKAQAVAARTYALYYMAGGNHRNDPFHLCDTQHCQVYGGKDCENSNTDRAVSESKGHILTLNGEAIAPYYHSTNGGFTECSGNVWATSLPYLQSVHDPYDDPHNPDNIRHTLAVWEKDVPLGLLSNLLTGSSTNNNIVNDVIVASQFPSGRVNELRISGGGQTVSFFKERARTILGLRSQFYSIREQPEKRVWVASANSGRIVTNSFTELEGKWAVNAYGVKGMLTGENFNAIAAGGRGSVPYSAYIFEGKGWGHGIGMSQYGAYNRSRAGHSYGEILSFYYPGTELRTAY